MLLNKLVIFLFLVLSVSCGVKGRPLPPLNPAPIGRGEPTYKTTTETSEESQQKKSP